MEKKPVAALIIAKAQNKGTSMPGPMAPKPEMGEKEVIAEELIAAIKAGDAAKVAMILQDFMAVCEGPQEEIE